jgi:hypothetical protein
MLTDLGALSGTPNSGGIFINSKSQVVGLSGIGLEEETQTERPV